MALPSKVSLALVAAGSLALVPWISAAQNITVDGRFSPAQTLVGPNYAITANLGKQVGSNLFHSFGQFGLATGESAAFSGPATISNVIGRVTGGNPSSIDGGIRSAITGANLYLINPSGIVFGPNATVNVSGSFHASTADYLKMSDGAKFQATNPDASTLSAAPPAAFGFLTARPAAITVNGSTLGPVPGTLGVVAGPVSITGATLSAPAGTIHVTSVAGTGEVPVDPRNTAASTVTSFGPVNIKGGSTLDVSDPTNLGSGGSVFIHAGALTIDASEINGDNYGTGPGGVLSLRGDNQITLSNGANVHSVAMGSGNGADVLLSTAPSGVILADAATVLTDTMGPGNSGSITIIAGQLTLQNGTNVLAQSSGSGSGGEVTVAAGGPLTIASGSSLGTIGFAEGNAGNVTVTIAGPITIDMSVGAAESNFQGIASQSLGSGDAGNVTVTAGTISIVNNGEIESAITGSGKAGDVTVIAFGDLTIDGSGASAAPNINETGIFSVPVPLSMGGAGVVSVRAKTLSIINSGEIETSTFSSGNAGSIMVTVSGQLTIDGSKGDPKTGVTGILSQAQLGTGTAGIVNVSAGALSIINSGVISTSTRGSGNAGNLNIAVSGPLTIDGSRENLAVSPTGMFSQTRSSGAAGTVSVSAGTAVIADDGTISSSTLRSGNGGSVSVSAGNLAIVRDGSIATDTRGSGSGNAGDVFVNVAGRLTIDGISETSFTGISSRSTQGSSSNAGGVMVSVGSLSIANGGAISTATDGLGAGGRITVATGDSTLGTGGQITSATAGEGVGGIVTVTAQGALSLSGTGSGIIASATPTASGDAGSVMVEAPQIAVMNGAEIASTTAGTGMGGSVMVTTPGHLMLDGGGIANTQIAASAIGPQSGPGGSVTVTADNLTIKGGAQIASSTAGPGKGGDIGVTVADGVTLAGSGPNGASGISAAALFGSSGAAGQVVLTAGGAIALSAGAQVTSSTAGTGRGGSVQVAAGGPLSLTDPNSGIIALATSTASGDAGSVIAAAPQITITSGAEIASTTAGTGAGGSVMVTTPGALVLNGAGVANTQIAASATGPQSGPGGSVTVSANSLTVGGGAQIASSTAGPGRGGNVDITVASDIVLPDPGPQITARSTGSGDAGSITVSAVRLLMSNGAAISTEAETSTASGGNITLHVSDFLFLVSSEITTSVNGETGNGGNITIEPPQLVILDHSSIIAQAIEGHGGNITITADQFIPSSDSIISASSQLGISGTVVINGPRVDVNGALVVLSSQLRGRTEVLREACAARADRPISSLVEAGRGGLPQDPEATLPALYIAGRDLVPAEQTATAPNEATNAIRATARLTIRCGGTTDHRRE